jgi:hypothetical protein
MNLKIYEVRGGEFLFLVNKLPNSEHAQNQAFVTSIALKSHNITT